MTVIDICNIALGKIGSARILALSEKDDVNLTNLYSQTRDKLLQLHHWAFALKRTRLSASGLLSGSGRTIAFVDSNPDTITDSGSGFITAGFEAGDIVNVIGSNRNNNPYRIRAVVAGVLTLETFETVVAESLTNVPGLKLYARPAHLFNYKYAEPSDCLDIIAVNETTINNQPAWDIEGGYVVTNEINSNDQIIVQYIRQVLDTTTFSRLFTECLALSLAAELAIVITNDKTLKDALLRELSDVLLNSFVTNTTRGNPDEAFKTSSWIRAGR